MAVQPAHRYHLDTFPEPHTRVGDQWVGPQEESQEPLLDQISCIETTPNVKLQLPLSLTMVYTYSVSLVVMSVDPGLWYLSKTATVDTIPTRAIRPTNPAISPPTSAPVLISAGVALVTSEERLRKSCMGHSELSRSTITSGHVLSILSPVLCTIIVSVIANHWPMSETSFRVETVGVPVSTAL